MAEELTRAQNESGGATGLRTMHADIARLRPTEEIPPPLTQPPAVPPASDRKPFPWLVLGLTAASALILGGGAATYYWYVSRTPTPPPPAAPPPLIFFDATREVIIGRTPAELRKALALAEQSGSQIGSFERLIIRIRNEAGGAPVMEVKDFLELLGVILPLPFGAPLPRPPEFFIYRRGSAPELGIMIAAEASADLAPALRQWEPALHRELATVLLHGITAPETANYQNFSYRNIDYRYFRFDPASDRGIGYLSFPARNLLVIAQSEEAIQATINRLFEYRDRETTAP